jgi:hypothetical protein
MPDFRDDEKVEPVLPFLKEFWHVTHPCMGGIAVALFRRDRKKFLGKMGTGRNFGKIYSRTNFW